MPLDLARIEKKAISESVAEQLRTAILRGEVQVGERLPPERELAPRFGTNRNTLREAIRSLEAQGLVVARQGGPFRADPSEEPACRERARHRWASCSGQVV